MTEKQGKSEMKKTLAVRYKSVKGEVIFYDKNDKIIEKNVEYKGDLYLSGLKTIPEGFKTYAANNTCRCCCRNTTMIGIGGSM